MLAAPLGALLPSSAAVAVPVEMQSGGPPRNGTGDGRGDWGDGRGISREFVSNEVAQVAAATKPAILTLASFAVTRRAYSKVSNVYIHYLMIRDDETKRKLHHLKLKHC